MPGGTSSAAVQNTSGNNARLPMMIASNGSPGIYEEYKACGPVVIAQANKDGVGNLIDMSQILFDPDWISHQPAFAFASGEAGGEIKF